LEIAHLIATYSADTRNFERGNQRVQQGLSQTSGRFNSAGSSSVSFWKLAGGGALANLATSALSRLASSLTDIATKSITTAADFDALTRGLVAITGSTQEAERQLARLKEVAKLPGLGFREAIQGSISLQAVGFNAANAERALMAFGKAVAFTGGGKEELSRITVQLAQLSSKGKILSQDLRPIIEAAPAVGEALKDAFGTVDTEQIQKLGLTTDQFLSKLETQLEKLPPITNSAKNAMENFGDTMDVAFATIGKPLLEPLTQALDSLTPIIAKVAQSVAATFPAIATEVKSIFDGLPAAVKETFQNILGTVQTLGGSVLDWFKTNYPLIKQTVVTVLTGVANFWQAHGEQIKAVVGGYLKAVGNIVSAVMSAINGDWAGAWGKLGSAALNALSAAWNSVKFMLSTWAGGLKTEGATLYEAAKALGVAVGKGIWDGIKSQLHSLVFFLDGMIEEAKRHIVGANIGRSIAEGMSSAGGEKSHGARKTGKEFVQEMAHGIKEGIPVVVLAIDDLLKSAADRFAVRARIVGESFTDNLFSQISQSIISAMDELAGEKSELQKVNELIKQALANPETAARMDDNTQALLRFVAAMRDAKSLTRERIVGLPLEMRSEGTETRERSVIQAGLDTSGTRERRVFGPTDEQIQAYNQRIKDMAQQTTDVLVDAFRAGFDGGLKGFLDSIFRTLTSFVDNQLRKALNGLFENIFSNASSGSSGGGFWSGLLKSVVGAVAGGAAGGAGGGAVGAGGGVGRFIGLGARAEGGDVKAGWLYRVNENHTEYFRPKTDGHIYNQNQMGRSSGTTNVFNISLPGASPTNYTERKSAREAADKIVSFLQMRLA
jgi:tape measure domain-containing protein